MATITLNLDERSMKNGMAQVRIRISHKGTNCFIGTSVWIEPQYFQPDTLHDAVHRKAQMAADKRLRISEQVQRIEDYLDDVDRAELATMTANDIRDRCGLGKCKSTPTNDARCVPIKHTNRVANRDTSEDFVLWFSEYGDSRMTEKTRKSYEYGWNVLRDYCKSLGLQTLTFSDIDYARLADFARWLSATGKGHSTRNMLESYVRAAYREAQKRHMVSREHDPYLDYSIKPVPRKTIEVLTAEQMHQLQTVQLPCGLSRARDIAMMSFYTCGANLLDLYEMAAPKHGEVKFVRHKTQRANMEDTCIRVEPEMRALLNLYGGSDRLLRFKGAYANYDTFQRRVTRQLYGVSDALGFNVTMAKIRRTWATLAAELDVSELVINKSMGHVVNTINANHYVKYEWSKTANANRKVIDYVLSA